MASKRASKSIKKRTAKDDAAELRKIERLLGEEYDSLAQARRALKKETTPVRSKKKAANKTASKQATSKVKSQKQYTIRELNITQKRSLESVLLDKKSANEISAKVLKKNEQWGALIPHKYTGTDFKTHKGYARTFQLYEGLDDLFKKITGYVDKAKSKGQTKVAKFLDDIKIVKWGTPPPNRAARENKLQWREDKQNEVKERVERKRIIRKKITDLEKENRRLKRELAKHKKGKRK